ncbi:hypothetical protein AB3X52_14420 [Nocardioides sp. DS6]|uniref:Uncharacterized protein n=1 Tax=Nocardioides eburneus TaxID=3231482 RepID=A0ABV3T108_9ACTN
MNTLVPWTLQERTYGGHFGNGTAHWTIWTTVVFVVVILIGAAIYFATKLATPVRGSQRDRAARGKHLDDGPGDSA